MLDKIRQKVRALINDQLKSDIETFEYTTSNIFTLAQTNINEIIKISVDGIELASAEWSFDSATNEITITMPSGGQIIVVKYNYYKYSNTELNEYVRSALVWISVFSYIETDFEVDEDGVDIVPTPDLKTQDLISLISAILINPDYNQYILPTVKVIYNNRISKEDKIEKLINKFKQGIGSSDVLEYD